MSKQFIDFLNLPALLSTYFHKTFLLTLRRLFQLSLFHLILSCNLSNLTFHSSLLSIILFLVHSQLPQLFRHLLDSLSHRMPLTEFFQCTVGSMLFCQQHLQTFVRLMSPAIEGVHELVSVFRTFIFQALTLCLQRGLLLIIRLFLAILKCLLGIFQFSSCNIVFLLYRGMGFQKVVQQHLFVGCFLLNSILTISKRKFFFNAHGIKILSCLRYLFQFSFLFTKLFSERIVLLLIFGSEFLLATTFLFYVCFHFRCLCLQKRYLLFAFSHSMIQHLPHIQQLLVKSHYLSSLFGNLQCLLAYRVITVSCLSEPAVYFVILAFEIRNQPSISLQIDGQIFISHRLYNGVLHEVCIQFGIQEHVLYASRNVLIVSTLHQSITRVFMIMSIAKDNVLEHHARVYPCRDSHIFVDTFTNLYPIAQYLLVIID